MELPAVLVELLDIISYSVARSNPLPPVLATIKRNAIIKRKIRKSKDSSSSEDEIAVKPKKANMATEDVVYDSDAYVYMSRIPRKLLTLPTTLNVHPLQTFPHFLDYHSLRLPSHLLQAKTSPGSTPQSKVTCLWHLSSAEKVS